MGQYHHIVNVDKREYLNPHELGMGLKMWEQATTWTAQLLLGLTSTSNGRGGGGFPEHELIGRWAGDRIMTVGDYTEAEDVPGYSDGEIPIESIYTRCTTADYLDFNDPESAEQLAEMGIYSPENLFTNISDLACDFIETLNEGMFVGTGWRDFVEVGQSYKVWTRDFQLPDSWDEGRKKRWLSIREEDADLRAKVTKVSKHANKADRVATIEWTPDPGLPPLHTTKLKLSDNWPYFREKA